jgi:RNA polymerase sigma factor (sigma-70 family)
LAALFSNKLADWRRFIGRNHVQSGVDTTLSPDDWDGWLAANVSRFLFYARERTACEADAEDVLQDALVEAWERTPGGGVPDGALVYATIRRRAIDRGRSQQRRQRREEKSATGEEVAWFSSDLEDAETRALLERAVRSLPENLREVVALHIWGGLTFAEVAAATGCPLNTAASRYRYGIDALRQRLKGVLV